MDGRCWQRQSRFAACVGVGLALAGLSPLRAAAQLAVGAQEQAATPVRLAELEGLAQRAQPNHRLDDARLEEARARIQAARAGYAPSVTLLSEVSLAPGQRLVDIEGYKVAAAFPIGTHDAWLPAPRYGVTVDVRGNLYDFGRTSAAVDAAEAQARAQHAEQRSSERQMLHDVRAGYLRWATAHALWSIARRADDAEQARLARTQAAIEEGARPTADSAVAQSVAGFARLELERALAELEGARQDLAFVAAVEIADGAYPADDLLHLPVAAPRADAGAEAQLQVLREQRSAAQASARAHGRAFSPVLSATAQAGIQGLRDSLFPVYRVGVNLAVPLWDGGAESASRAQSNARAAQLGAQAELLERGRAQAQKRAELVQRQAERRIRVAEELVALCRARLSQLESAASLGAASAVSYAMVGEAQSALSRAETELVMARALRAQASLGL
jgi:outer membrane protein TolC